MYENKYRTKICDFTVDRLIVIHFYFGTDLISVISVQVYLIKSLPKFQLRVDGVWMPLALPNFSQHRNGEFSLYRKLYATEMKVD